MEELQKTDPQIADLIQKEAQRQASCLRMIPSENYASKAVMTATGSVLTNKYSEGYPHQRYYQGQEFIDQIEDLALKRAKELFQAEHANVQPYSGSPANMAVYLASLKPGGRVMGMDLAAGGHLTHGAKVSFSGKFYEVRQYGLSRETGLIDYDLARNLAKEFKPGLIFAGCSSYPRTVDFAAFGEIAREAGAVLCADISHISGLCLTGCHPHPFPHADVVTSTTHKLLRGPRGGMVLCRQELAAKIDKAVFPGLQGGPHNHVTAAIAVALKEASLPAYAEYCRQVVKNAAALARELMARGFSLVTGGTDNHLALIDASTMKLTGKVLAQAMDQAGIVANANKVPFDPRPADDPSGVRLGTPALTSRGMQEPEMVKIAEFIHQVAQAPQDQANLRKVRDRVAELCAAFPAPGIEI
ncbi:serine hydroxymethyltransferase [Desulfocarbo indianensis]|nr:serine hydroxymethyltransferase [Desulfocarbo indianensis]